MDEARENFKKYQIMYSPERNTTVTGGDSEERKNIKNELISIFEKMLKTENTDIAKLWKKALKVEKKLDEELKRSIREYENSIKL